VAIIEGDEYLASALEPVPKFHLYRPDIALISGIAWDHINVFKTFESYVDQFRKFIDVIEPGGKLIYCAEDPEVKQLAEEQGGEARASRTACRSTASRRCDVLMTTMGSALAGLRPHNLMNLEGARHVCHQLGIGDARRSTKPSAPSTVRRSAWRNWRNTDKGWSSRISHIRPSKLKATVDAVREQFPGRRLVACMELHTYSSLSEGFLDQYAGCDGPGGCGHRVLRSARGATEAAATDPAGADPTCVRRPMTSAC
jgi:UDP-N-acetylmuramate: L-alanyl-gamma-D-glutamyl-meso-diaminopimelate ligase